LGGLICAVPQALLARWLFAYYRASASKRIVQKFYLGELFKLLFTGLLFVGALLKWPNQAPELLLGFISAQLGFWFAPYLVKLRVK
jgi:ATP synthase protein I